MTEAARPSETPTRLTARALIVGERIDTAGLERPDMISSLPLAFRVGPTGMVALFRFGAAVMVGLTPLEEEDTLARLKSRVIGARARGDDETAVFEIAPEDDDVERGGRPDPDQEPFAAALSGHRRRARQDGGPRPRRARGQRGLRRHRAVRGQARPLAAGRRSAARRCCA